MSTARTARIMGRDVDVSRAAPDLVRFLASYFEAKSADDVDVLMGHFLPESVTYTDATLGWIFRDWQTLYDKFAELLAAWPAEAVAWPTRIVGDFDSAVVFFTDSPEMFGRELRAAGTVDFREGKIVRWVDTWDGRSLTAETAASMRVPHDVYPADFGEQKLGEKAAPVLRRTAREFAAALVAGDAARASSLLHEDVAFEDTSLHLLLEGRSRTRDFLDRTLADLAYGPGSALRHVVGSAQGGAYEWSTGGRVPAGVTALELDGDGTITRVTSTWDASLTPETVLHRIQNAAIVP
ncbi:nuclear transport factor 2 family protein [Streptomyces sp. NPDC088732]|uniref:nuclear transport factor 2 family protein n=1 Tax=Streptomyces sp. NPDC088732 TaxID=3365879 RepID=UPI0038019BFE